MNNIRGSPLLGYESCTVFNQLRSSRFKAYRAFEQISIGRKAEVPVYDPLASETALAPTELESPKMSSDTKATAAVPETLPGLQLMGFICCKCGEATLDKKFSERCFDSKCGHARCSDSCQIFDRAGRLWKRQFLVPISWLCVCGRVHSVLDTLVSRLTRPICPYVTPGFAALYNTTGRLCKGLTISSPFPLNTTNDAKQLLLLLESTPWGLA